MERAFLSSKSTLHTGLPACLPACLFVNLPTLLLLYLTYLQYNNLILLICICNYMYAHEMIILNTASFMLSLAKLG